MFDVSSLSPDWTRNWTAKEAEYELYDFKFAGPGWYLIRDTDMGKLDAMLVVPCVCPEERSPFEAKWPEDTLFKFCIYNNRNPAADLQAIVNAPVRQDER